MQLVCTNTVDPVFQFFIFKARRDWWDVHSRFQYQEALICLDLRNPKVDKTDAYSYAEFTKTRGRAALYVTFGILYQHKHHLHNNKGSMLHIWMILKVPKKKASDFFVTSFSLSEKLECLQWTWGKCSFKWWFSWECVSVFVWCDTAASDCPVFPFPLWLITRVPVNPWYHRRIKSRSLSPREPISSESRTQTGNLLDIFVCPETIQTSGGERCAATSACCWRLHASSQTWRLFWEKKKNCWKRMGSEIRIKL